MLRIETPQALRQVADEAWQQGRRLGLVPTMGNLHAGHMALVRHAQQLGCTPVVVSIFVNPLQFAANEDFAHYPRTLEADLRHCALAGVDAVFVPDAALMVPASLQTAVEVGELAAVLEGQMRPTHFRGVATLVAKLLQLTAPCTAVFGRKDYQQWRIVSRMVEDLAMPVLVVGHPTVREADGLAFSSRNRRLDAVERRKAAALPAALQAAAKAWSAGERRPLALERAATVVLTGVVDQLDYVSVVDADSLRPIEAVCGPRALLAIAARIGATRLIDNLVLGEEDPPLVALADEVL